LPLLVNTLNSRRKKRIATIVLHNQCCGSGSGIWCFFDSCIRIPYTRDVFHGSQLPMPGYHISINISWSLPVVKISWVKILILCQWAKFFSCTSKRNNFQFCATKKGKYKFFRCLLVFCWIQDKHPISATLSITVEIGSCPTEKYRKNTGKIY
jgi:hypothetical protein